jgi:hypothetical protein
MHPALLLRLALLPAPAAGVHTHAQPLACALDASSNRCDPSVECVHGLGRRRPCPVCHAHAYLCKRIGNTVRNGMARLGAKKKRRIEDVLGVMECPSWAHACEHITRKMRRWNREHRAHPERQMLLSNISIDHIRPVSAFKRSSAVPAALCHHHTNLQPLLMHDDAWKADAWSAHDEAAWLDRIVLAPDFDQVYFSDLRVQPSLLCGQFE